LRARFDDRADEKPDETADHRPNDGDEKDFATEAPAVLPERKKSLGDEKGLEKRGYHGYDYAGNDTDQYVVRSPPHPDCLRFSVAHSFIGCAVTIADLSALADAAASLARELRPGMVVALEGDLGAGKTTFVAALVRALGNPADVSSPTFTFWHRYGGSPPLEHLDLYRVESANELTELGLEEAFAPDGIAFVEWPDRIPGLVPPGAMRVRLTGSGEGPREIEIVRPARIT
jgi:tRNA threonylcarbamoyladenosine biosynthesis protein TsaE